MSFLLRFTLPLAILALVFSASNAAAQCESCASNGTGHGVQAVVPSTCHSCGHGALHDSLHRMHIGLEKYKAGFRLNHSRGSAWPLPFSCWDREHYYAIMNQQFATGLQVAHTLTSEYFDPETNELNRAGEMRVGWIMQNSPQASKQIFVYQDQTGPTIQQRIDAIRKFSNRYYGHLGQVAIASSQIRPHQVPALYQAQTNTLYSESMPDPIIPLEAGASLSNSINN